MRVSPIVFVLLTLAPISGLEPDSAAAQAPPTQPTSAPNDELPAAVLEALQSVSDFAFNFDNPGFYAVLEYVKTMPGEPDASNETRVVADWSALLERPSDFRGRPITIEGVVGRNKAWRFEQPERRHLGELWQLELSAPGWPLTTTVILTENTADVPVGTVIRVTGYFVMIRQYYGSDQRVRQAALLVGHGPTLVASAPSPVATQLSNRAAGLIVVALAAAVIVWMILRRSAARRPGDVHVLRAGRPAPLNLSDDLSRWASDAPELQDDSENDAPAPKTTKLTSQATDEP